MATLVEKLNLSIRLTSQLLLVVLLVGVVQIPAQGANLLVDSDETAEREDAPCQDQTDQASALNETSGQEDNTQPDEECETQSAEQQSDKSRQELVGEITENTQSVKTLRELLLGRSYTFFGRAEPEYAVYSNGVLDDDDGFDMRRFRVGMVGVLSDTVSYKGELDLTDHNNNLSDFYLKWQTFRLGSFMIGNQRVAQNLSAMTSSISQIFMERPLPVTTFSLARRLSVSQDLYLKKLGFHAVIFSKDPNNDAGKYGASVRIFTNPIMTDDSVSHVGFSLVRERMDRDARYRTRPESHVTDIRLVDTGEYPDVSYQNIAGVELAGARGAFTARLEGFASQWQREETEDNWFYGAYAEIGYFLTGQAFNYRHGKFVNPVISDGSRAWELGLRASWVDLDDGEIRGGKQANLGAALNFYFHKKMRAQFNVIYYDAQRDQGDERGWIAQTRLEIQW
ncbi:MAG: porin [Gammaproteobacteria bacterium]|nr:porin [Gammaproteobacteria bacterium]